ncbi:muconate/chloromuconate family cycloisomerase [Paraburkholderia caballeronis]|uniref:muconate/chloromuconate family cycloisomerase n=1 Tax=Paraburkholderia caballeronis TaxID=416943 RepID=UPI0010CF9A26|nr:muconate/chloromuconate family cycloisomerase [Paraburkholderia caballeronis]TDV07121.1 muconate cycloisomerase [Paraburkholderia caballeronis]TDV11265.1 muconate cycloisomerase [Paraburkholderia caballeronis]TDV22450.1 muconate cycloisomerase [Paraburkholderia caballeronis]
MRIVSVESILVDLPTIRPHKLAMATINTQSLVLVRVRDGDGREGWGEASVIPHYGSETVEAIKVVIDQYLGPAVVGANPLELEALHRTMNDTLKDNHYAKAAVEMACVDLVARRLGVPSSALFGGALRDRLRVLLVLGNGDPERDVALAEEKLEQRVHDCFLVKVGNGEPRADVARALAVKRALGERARVHVDANQRWDEATATWAIERLQDGGIAVIEQPLPRDDIDGMRRLTERFTVPVMADEAIDTIGSAFAFARVRAADAFSIKVTKHGGMLPTRKVATIAEAAGISMFGGTMLESGIGTAAYAQLFSTVRGLDWGCQLFGPLLFGDTLTTTQPEYRDFHLLVPQGPGFGIEIDTDKLAFYRRDGGRYRAAATH